MSEKKTHGTTEANNKKLYIILSQSGSIVSKILHVVTKDPYNHVSLSLESDLSKMYSFGRRRTYNPFWGGFVKESPHYGTMKRFIQADVAVFSIDVSEETYRDMQAMFDFMIKNKYDYHYNYLGLFLAGLNIPYKPTNRYYCSEFAKEVLENYQIEGTDTLSSTPHPIEFLDFPNSTLVYQGKLAHFAK